MKLTLFAWIPASSAGMTILLFAAQLSAAGVCVVCPPGYNCPAGGEPALAGEPGQVLSRTAEGAEWVPPHIAIFRGPQGATGSVAQITEALIGGPEPFLFGIGGYCDDVNYNAGRYYHVCRCYRYRLGSLHPAFNLGQRVSRTSVLSPGTHFVVNNLEHWRTPHRRACPQNCARLCKTYFDDLLARDQHNRPAFW